MKVVFLLEKQYFYDQKSDNFFKKYKIIPLFEIKYLKGNKIVFFDFKILVFHNKCLQLKTYFYGKVRNI